MPEGPNKLTENKERLPTVICAIILKQENGRTKLLLIYRAKKPEGWALSSGKGFLNPKHKLTPDEAVIKEVEVDLGTSSFKGEKVFDHQSVGQDGAPKVIRVYAGSVNESELRAMAGEIKDFKWVSLEEAMREKLAFDGNEIIKQYLNSKKK